MKTPLLSILVATASLVACSTSDLAIGARADAAPASTSGDAGSSAAPDDAATERGPEAAATGPCTAGYVCLDVSPVRPGTQPLSGLLVVFWEQLAEGGPDPNAKVAYSAPFDGAATRVSIPLAEITLPNEENLFCSRACEDESACPCLSAPKIGVAQVVVVADQNGNGVADLGNSEASSERWIGAGRVIVAYSEVEHVPAPYPVSVLFPDGVRAGVHRYAAVPRASDPIFDSLVVAPDDAVFSLGVCDTLDIKLCQPHDWQPNLT
jgi:hypothetical protein